ncbi:MAG: galactose mutarotase, partial [Dysgonamonadaceae bacterium]|nr:galactose mutarotase [Dysgonamonadaceae bacterium]
MKKNLFALLALTLLIVACGKKEQVEQTTVSGLLPSKFEGMFEEKDSTHLYVMKNANGVEVCVTNIGGRIVSIMVPDKEGAMKDVVLGFDNIENYKGIGTNFGAIIGRYGNRIAGGKFELYRVSYELRKNNGNNSLHGGPRGFHTQYFNIEQPDSQKLVCKYFSKTGEEGFPGNLNVTVSYTLTNDNALDIAYEATTDRPTVVNLTNHSYFNLSGDPNNTILDHILTMDC